MDTLSAIIFINSDLNDITINTLTSQLYITDHMTGQEFDNRISADPNYPAIIHGNHLRILVIRNDFPNISNRDLADVVLFYKSGLVAILKSNAGPPQLTLPVNQLSLYDLLRFNKSNQTVNLPDHPCKSCSTCHNCCCFEPCGLCVGGIFKIESTDPSGVHCANPDNLFNNTDFINRK